MTPIEAVNHGDGSMTIVITEQAQIDWLRSMQLSEAFLTLGKHHVPSEECRKLYPTLCERLEPTLARFLDGRE